MVLSAKGQGESGWHLAIEVRDSSCPQGTRELLHRMQIEVKYRANFVNIKFRVSLACFNDWRALTTGALYCSVARKGEENRESMP